MPHRVHKTLTGELTVRLPGDNDLQISLVSQFTQSPMRSSCCCTLDEETKYTVTPRRGAFGLSDP